MTESQRAMVAAKIATLRDGQHKSGAPIGAASQDDAADMLNVGRRSVQRARDVLDLGSDALREAVEKGGCVTQRAQFCAPLRANPLVQLIIMTEKALQNRVR